MIDVRHHNQHFLSPRTVRMVSGTSSSSSVFYFKFLTSLFLFAGFILKAFSLEVEKMFDELLFTFFVSGTLLVLTVSILYRSSSSCASR